MKKTQSVPLQGLSLIEVVISLAIIALLAAYTIPSYRTQLMRGYRIDAVNALYRAANTIEQKRLDALDSDAPPALLPGETQAPQSGAAIYRLAVAPADEQNGGYAIEAIPLDSAIMGTDNQCGAFILDATGRRANRINAIITSDRVDLCWDGR